MANGLSQAVRQFFQFYEVAPALALALAVAVALPVLLGLGLALPKRRRPTSGRPLEALPGAGRHADHAEYDNVQIRGRSDLGLNGFVSLKGRNNAGVYRVGPHIVQIGSAADCHIVLDGPGIGAMHAVLMKGPDGEYRIVRLAAADEVGIYLDGKKVENAGLVDGQTLKIGRHLIAFNLACHGLVELPVQAGREKPVDRSARRMAEKGQAAWAGNAVGAEVGAVQSSVH